MKNYLLVAMCFLLLLLGCEENAQVPIVDERGLTREITDLVPQAILDEMETLGMPLNGGNQPPNVSGTYLASPFILLNSNRLGDVAGSLFADYKVTFSKQNDQDLTVMVDYDNSNATQREVGEGIGSFIVGEQDQFSVFVKVNSVFNDSLAFATLVHVISGKIQNDGIKDLHFANFMLDNQGNPQGVWIEVGEGRVLNDQDGFSEKQ